MKRRRLIKGLALSILASKFTLPNMKRNIPIETNTGGLVQGGIVPGVGSSDHIPFLLEPGELYMPRGLAVELGYEIETED